MKTLAIWSAKRYALSLVQDMVKARSKDVAKWAVAQFGKETVDEILAAAQEA